MDCRTQLMRSDVPKYKTHFIMKTYNTKDIIYALKRLNVVKWEYECMGDSLIYLLNTLEMKRGIRSDRINAQKRATKTQKV